MDLSNFDVRAAAGAGAELHLKHPATGELLHCSDGTPFTVTVLGRDAPEVQEAMRAANEKRAKGDVNEQEAGRLVVAATIAGWSAEMELDGKPLAFNAKNVMRLLTDERTDWIAEQITPFTLSRRNFVKNMSAS